MVVGELDDILERFEREEQPLEQRLARLMLEAEGDADIRRGIDALGRKFNRFRADARRESSGGALESALPALSVVPDGADAAAEARP